MVGDTIYDIAAAKAAGVPAIAVTFGYSEIPVDDLGADALTDDFAALPGIARKLLKVRLPA